MDNKKTELDVNELTLLINVVSQVNVPVKESVKFVDLINKMSKIIDETKEINST